MAPYRLRTFGGLSLTRATIEGEANDGEVASQRKALALLAILAAAGARGVPRDRLLGLLWPESDTERARGALKTMLHAQRRQLGAPESISGVAELRLGAAHIDSDVQSFRAALAAGDDEAAVAVYGGPFLDGVYLDATPDFERWVDDERAQLAAAHRDALQRLATRASREGRTADAVRWWRARHAADPLHAPTSLHLMRALVAAGDRDGALVHARAHEALVRAELDVPPDPEVARLAEQLRAGRDVTEQATAAPPVPAQVSLVPRSPEPASHVPPSPVTTAPVETPAPVARPRAAVADDTPRRRRGLFWWGAASLVLMAAIAVAAVLLSRPASPPEPVAALRANRVAVAVFVNRTGERALDALGTMVSDWVTRGLARTPGAEVFDIGGLFLSGRAPDGAPVEPRAMARANGAGLVVAGNYYKVGGRITFSVQLLDVQSGRVLRVLEPIEGDAAHPLAAVDEVRQRVAVALATILDPRSSVTISPEVVPPTYAAYSEYAAGQEIYWRGNWEGALPHFRRAAQLDTNFTSALALVSVAAVGTGRCALADSVLQALARRRRDVPEIDWLTVQISVARCASDHDTHNRLQRERLALVPGSRMFAMTMSTGFRQLNRPGEALAILADFDPASDLGWLPLPGRTFFWRELASNHHLLRDYRAERAVAERMRLAHVAPLATGFVRARALAALGRGDSALAALDTLAVASPDPALVSGISGHLDPMQLATPGWVMEQVALELSAHGDSVRARAAMERAARWFEAASSNGRMLPFAQALTLARVMSALGRAGEARAQVQSLVRHDSTSIDARGTLGVLAAREGDRETARQADRWLATRPSRFPIGLPVLYRAQIAAVLGDTTTALAHLRALPHEAHPLDVQHFHIDPALAALRGTETMRRWMVPRG